MFTVQQFYFCLLLFGDYTYDKAKYVGVGYAVLLVMLWLFQDTLSYIFQFAMSLEMVFLSMQIDMRMVKKVLTRFGLYC